MSTLASFHIRTRVLGLVLTLFVLSLVLVLAVPADTASAAARGQDPTQLNSLSKTVRLVWETANEMNVVGFYVWRRTGKTNWARLSDTMIPSKNPGGFDGARYVLRDNTVKLGHGYYYEVEVVLSDGTSLWSPQIRVRVQ
jgi:hypothetical protein